MEYCCIRKFRQWILDNEFANSAQLDKMEEQIVELVKKEQVRAWQKFQQPIQDEKKELLDILGRVTAEHPSLTGIEGYRAKLADRKSTRLNSSHVAISY